MGKFFSVLRANKIAITGLISAVLVVAGLQPEVVTAITNLVAVTF